MLEELETLTISGFGAGEDLQVEREVLDIPDGQTLAIAWITIKARPRDADTDAILQKRVTTTPVVGTGYISNDTDAGSAMVLFEFSALDTSKLTPGVAYYYDIKVQTNLLRTKQLERGNITADRLITLTTT